MEWRTAGWLVFGVVWWSGHPLGDLGDPFADGPVSPARWWGV